MCLFFFFFFKQKTAYEMRISDWSSDVCSSDLGRRQCLDRQRRIRARLCRVDPRCRRRPELFRDGDQPCRAYGEPACPRGAYEHALPRDDQTLVWRRSRPPPADPLSRGHRRLSRAARLEEHTSELQSIMRTSYAV